MNGVQTRFKCKLDVKRCKRFVFPPSSLLPRSNALKTKAIRYFQTDRTLTRIVSPPLNRAQIAYNKLWNSYIGSPKEKIINFILSRSMRPEGEKRLKIKMEDLAGLIDETRINVSKELNDMQEKGLVELSRKEIFIPAMEKLSE